MIIDIHAHTSNKTMWELHTEHADISTLEKMAQQFGITKIVLMATYFPFKGTGLHNKRLFERIKGHPLFLMFGSLDIMNNFKNGLKELRQLAEKKLIAGIKLYPGYQDFLCSDDAIFPLYELALEFNLPVMFHSGELHHCCPKKRREDHDYPCGKTYCAIDQFKDLSRPRQVVGAIQAFPKVNFVLSHLGNPYFQELQDLMQQYQNIFTDISGQFISATNEDTPEYRKMLKKEMLKFLKIPGVIDRFMFGTDFPIQSYKDSLELIEALKLSPEEQNKILYHNANQLLHLEV